MQRSYQYLFLSLFIIFALTSFYICFDIYIQGSEFDKKQIQFLSQRLERKALELELAQINLKSVPANGENKRNLASVHSGHANSMSLGAEKDLSTYQFIRVDELKKAGKFSEAMEFVGKIKKSATDEAYQARADYEFITLECRNYKFKESCIETLDNMVIQYPQSEWTGMGLLWLAKTYKQMNRRDESVKIRTLLQKENFTKYPMISSGLKGFQVE